MAYLQGNYLITHKQELASGFYSMTVAAPQLAGMAAAGQFVHIRVKGCTLRRPISICQLDSRQGTIRLVFQVRGEGTRELAQLQTGQEMDLLGPLGNGFTLLEPAARAVVVGGGIGVPPLLEAAKFYRNPTAILGFRSADTVILAEDFAAAGSTVLLSTDDGSMGTKGYVTGLLEQRIQEGGVDIIYACGPAPMLEGAARLARRHKLRIQLSLEERMACGVGACLVCACKIKLPDGSEVYRHVCKDGPVFEGEEVFDTWLI